MKGLRLREFRRQHVVKAAALFCAQFERQRVKVPDLPEMYAEPKSIIPLISRLSDGAPGVAAFQNGAFVGYLIGVKVPRFMSSYDGVYCPEWAHGASLENRRETYQEMYKSIAEKWVQDGGIRHCITHLADDREAIEAFSMLGFGTMTIDAIRGTSVKPTKAPAGVVIARIRPEQAEAIMPLSRGLEEHLGKSPSFVHVPENRGSDYYRAFLSGKGKSIWAAWYRNRPVSYLKCEPSTGASACQIVKGPGVMAISGAYTRPELRKRGVATAILSRLLEQARKERYTSCSVDFESANSVATGFWLGHFRPVCISMMRYIDERITSRGKAS